ncbi:MAG: hypothetical protein WC595_01690 [Candidatus Nanoarchaeia archaeon]
MDIDVLEQTPLTMAELKDKLDAFKAHQKDKELNFRATKVYDYLTEFVTIDGKKAQDLKEKIQALNVSRLKDKHIIKIIDLQPESTEEIKSILTGENLTVKTEDLTKIISALKE